MLYAKVVSGIVVVSSLLIAIIAPALSAKFQDESPPGFEQICQSRSLAGDIPIYKYVSLRTGLRVVVAQIEGPIVQGFLAIATEAKDDDGLPHTLEHLAFLGSEDYPYKGVLDLLANRCLAVGTNAWTAVDHTAYTIKTAGKDGVLNILPIFMDHLLYPTLTDSGFVTEVYHITGTGEDAGVVYSEMQARENTGGELTNNALIEALYPVPSGYRYETGGKMADIRDHLTNDKIRNYHKLMYRPENMNVIITGQVEPSEVFDALKVVEDKIVSKGDRGPFNKPWTSPVPPLTKSEDIEVLYPSSSEDTGIIRIGWRGPSIVNNMTEYQSMTVLMKYMTDNSVSPLQQVFVEVGDPYASFVYGQMLPYSISSCFISLSGVPKAKIDDVMPIMTKTLRKIADNEIPFNLAIMKDILNNLILKQESSLESSPHSTFSSFIIRDLLYGKDCDTLNQGMNKISWYRHLLNEPSSYWLALVKRYLLSSKSVLIRGVPSSAESKRIQDEKKERVEKRKKKLGESGLKEWEEKVTAAKEINEIPPPDSMLQSIPVPSTDNIKFHSLKVYTNIENQNIPKSDPSLFDFDVAPVKMQLDDINSNFVEFAVILNTTTLDPSDRLYLPLLMEVILESSIMKGNKKIPFNEVIKNLSADTIEAHTMNGVFLGRMSFSYGSFMNNVGLNFKVEMSQYEKGIEWLSDFLHRVVFNIDRVSVKANKLFNSIGDKKRSGRTIFQLIYNSVIYKADTNKNIVNPLRQETFLKSVISKLKTDPIVILKDLNRIYRELTNADRMVVHMASNLQKLAATTDINKPWLNFLPNGYKSTDMSFDPIPDWKQQVPFDRDQTFSGIITGVGSEESSYVAQTSPGITDTNHPDLPVLLVAINYLTQMEGPMWKQIRGRGLSYSYAMSMKTNSGLLSFQLVKAAQAVGAYKEGMKIINSHINGSEPWKPLLFESARSSLIYKVINREAEVSNVVQQSIYSYYKRVPHDYNRNFVNAINNVKFEELDRVAKKYFNPLVDPEQSKTVVVCPPSTVDVIVTELEKMGHSFEVIENVEKSRLAAI